MQLMHFTENMDLKCNRPYQVMLAWVEFTFASIVSNLITNEQAVVIYSQYGYSVQGFVCFWKRQSVHIIFVKNISIMQVILVLSFWISIARKRFWYLDTCIQFQISTLCWRFHSSVVNVIHSLPKSSCCAKSDGISLFVPISLTRTHPSSFNGNIDVC